MIQEYEPYPYSIIHLQIWIRGKPNYLNNMTTEFDRDDISSFENGLSYSNSEPILINADTRSYPGSVISFIPCDISHVAEPVKDASEFYYYRGMHVSTSPPRSVLSYHVGLTSTPVHLYSSTQLVLNRQA